MPIWVVLKNDFFSFINFTFLCLFVVFTNVLLDDVTYHKIYKLQSQKNYDDLNDVSALLRQFEYRSVTLY